MATPFDPRKVLKHISNSLLREFFVEQRNELRNVPWDDLTEHKIEPVFEAWQDLPEQQKLEIQIILRDIHTLADHRGVAVLAEEILWRCPDRAEAFKAQVSKQDKAMWVYLHQRAAFDEAAMFARADALAAGQQWFTRNGLPKRSLTVDDELKQRLEEALQQFYGPKQMRGRVCKVEHYSRIGGSEYFFAYLDDYPDKQIVFNAEDRPIIRSDRRAFENVFVYNSEDGSMEVYARGGRKVWEQLQVAFCKAVLDEDVDPADPVRPSFKLDHLLAPDFPLPTDPNDLVEEARIARLRLVPPGSGGYIEIKADPRAHPNDIYRKVERWLKPDRIPVGSTRVVQATFRLKFQQNGSGRQPVLTFDVSAPNSCNLKSKPDEQRVVGERCLKMWEVTDDEQ